MKVVKEAVEKIEDAAENVFDQASVKFLQQANEAQSSTQKVDEVVNKAAKRSYDQALAKCSEQAIEAQSSTKKVEEHIQKTFARFSEQLNELSTSFRTQQNQQRAVNIERAETARHATVDNPRGSEKEPMEIEEDEVASVAKTEDEDEDSPVDAFKRTCEHPRPGSIYAIHMGNDRESMLAANKILN